MEGTHLTHVQGLGPDLPDERARNTSDSEVRRAPDSGHHHALDPRMGFRAGREKIFAEYGREFASSADFHIQSGKGVVRSHTESSPWRHHRTAQASTAKMGADAYSSVRFVGTAETESPDDGGSGSDNG